jgi:hypothetical protein
MFGSWSRLTVHDGSAASELAMVRSPSVAAAAAIQPPAKPPFTAGSACIFISLLRMQLLSGFTPVALTPSVAEATLVPLTILWKDPCPDADSDWPWKFLIFSKEFSTRATLNSPRIAIQNST